MEVIINLLYFVIVITPIVFIHELGHFVFARAFNVRVETFSIGFGKPIVKWNDKNNTTWQISTIPLGGYVKLYGDDSFSSKDKSKMSKSELNIAFFTKKVWQKILVVFGGPLSNYLLSFLIFFSLLIYNGKIEHKTEITFVENNSPAEKAGLLSGDILVSVDNHLVNSYNEFRLRFLMSTNDKLKIGYLRDGKELYVNVKPKAIKRDGIDDKYLGVRFEKYNHYELGVLDSIFYSAQQIMNMSISILQGIKDMISGERDYSSIRGPVTIAKYSVKFAEKGILSFLNFIAIISLTIGLMNLLPIPMLDGGYILFYAIESVTRKPLSLRAQGIILKIGFMILLSLMLLAFFNDIREMMF